MFIIHTNITNTESIPSVLIVNAVINTEFINLSHVSNPLYVYLLIKHDVIVMIAIIAI